MSYDTGVARMRCFGALVIATALIACSCAGRTDRTLNTESIDDDDASSDEDAGSNVLDAGRPADAKPVFDAWAYYCNVPEPGPCCCEPSQAELRVPPTEAGVTPCEFALSPFRPAAISLQVRESNGSEFFLSYESTCSAEEASWTYVSEDPPVVLLCPGTCDALISGEYEAVVVTLVCHPIACPPP
jgi:hypothetical protein